MRFFHTFCTKSIITRYSIPSEHILSLMHTALSVAWLKELGQDIVLHTDKLGRQLYDCLPYDEIIVDLDNNSCPPCFWASGKIMAITNETPDAVHIDTDYLIKSKDRISRIKNSDIIVSNIESTKDHLKVINDIRDLLNQGNVNHSFSGNERETLNMGIFKCTDSRIKEKFINRYFEYVTALSGFPQVSDYPDLIVEQLNLKHLLDSMGITPCTVIDRDEIEPGKDIGVCHLLSEYKYTKIPQIMKSLKELNPQIYQNVKNKYKEIGFKLVGLE